MADDDTKTDPPKAINGLLRETEIFADLIVDASREWKSNN